MIRKIQQKILIVLSITIAIILISSCSHCEIQWQLDAEYSEQLTIKSINYKEVKGKSIIDTVNTVRTYRTPGNSNDFYSLADLFKKDLIFESKDNRNSRTAQFNRLKV